jgi:O-antigen/teichoic acid export membrane protein
MADGRRLVRNFLSLSVAQALGFAFGLGTTVLLARALGPENFGILGFGQAFVAFAGIAIVLGTDTYGAREIARDAGRAGPLISEILGFRFAVAAVAIPGIIAIAAALGVAGQSLAVLSIQAVGLLAAVVTVDFAFQGIQRMEPIGVRQAGAAGLVFLGALAFVGDPDDVYVAALLPFIAVSVTSLWLIRRFHRKVAPIGVRLDPTAWRGWLGVVVPIGLGGLSVAVFQQIDIVMLGFFVPEDEIGRYVALARLYVLVIAVANLLAAVFAPVLAPLAGASRQERQEIYTPFVTYLLVLAAPAGAAFAVFPHDTIVLFFGDEYASASGVLAIVMASALLFTLTIPTSVALVAWDDQLYHTKALGISAAVNIVLNAALIPGYGILGAAAATLLSVAVLLAAELHRLARRHGAGAFAQTGTAAILLAVVFGVSYLLRSMTLPPDAPAAVVVAVFGIGAAVVYVGAAAAIGLVDVRRAARLLTPERRPADVEGRGAAKREDENRT